MKENWREREQRKKVWLGETVKTTQVEANVSESSFECCTCVGSVPRFGSLSYKEDHWMKWTSLNTYLHSERMLRC